jgi:hypothetical protein
MGREIEMGGIPVAIITSLPDIAEDNGMLRIIRGFGMPWPTGNPNFEDVSQESDMRRAILQKCLQTLTMTPAKPTVFWPNYGNCVGDLESVASPVNEQTKDWETL